VNAEKPTPEAVVTDRGLSRLARNSLHNFSALLVPTAVALVTTPFVVHRLGDQAFGLYMLTLSVVGFGGLLDLGLGTASVKFIAEEITRGDERVLSKLINSLVSSRLPLAALATSFGLIAAPAVCSALLAVPPALMPDAVFMVRVASVTLGVSMIIGSLGALPRAVHRFDITSRISMAFGLGMTVATVVLLVFGYGIRQIVVTELVLALVQLSAYWMTCRRLFPRWEIRAGVDVGSIKTAVQFGGLMSLGNVTSIVFIHVNRILVGRFLGAAAVTYFSVPWNVTSRISQFVYSLAEVVTPVASGLSADGATGQLRSLHRRMMQMVLVLSGTVVVPLLLVASDFLAIWLGTGFAGKSATTLRILTLVAGVLSVAMVPHVLLVGVGRPGAANTPAIVGAALNLSLAVWLGPTFGLEGIALTVLAGVAVQTALLEGLARKTFRLPLFPGRTVWRPLLAGAAATVLGAAAGSLIRGVWLRLAVLTALGTVGFHAVLWALGQYGPSERALLRRQVRAAAGLDAKPREPD
jgi:O-antigen/teichoic acid export membrane protein